MTKLNYQLPDYISWRLDPFVHGTDTLHIDWTMLESYALPLLLDRGDVFRKFVWKGVP